jgi:SAM-dependent methyltransferase
LLPFVVLAWESAGMGEAIADRVKRYILDGSDADLRRLMSVSEIFAQDARRSLVGAGVSAGSNVLDCGCGPMGALTVLAELVGPAGRVVGVDFSEPTIAAARTVIDTLGLENVDVRAGDLNELESVSLGGPFDLAYSRLFLFHQVDPLRTLRHLSSLLRPGGCIVAHEALRFPPPRSYPHLSAIAEYWELTHQLIEQNGGPRDVVEKLPEIARTAGLVVERADGFFRTWEPELGLGLHAASMAAARQRSTSPEVTSQIDEIVARIRGANPEDYSWVASPFFLDLTLRKPGSVTGTRDQATGR